MSLRAARGTRRTQEQYAEAGALRDELSRLHMDDTSAVLRVM